MGVRGIGQESDHFSELWNFWQGLYVLINIRHEMCRYGLTN